MGVRGNQPPIPLFLSSANLPPTLGKSQVSSVRKNLKLHLLSVLKHPASLEFQAQITTLLVDLGTPQAEIARNMPTGKDARKRPRDDSDPTLKKMKLGERAGQAGTGPCRTLQPERYSGGDVSSHRCQVRD